MPCAFAFLAVAFAFTTAAADPSATERYFEGLRQRGLFDLAEGEALRLLSDRPSADDRAALVGQLARTFAEHAKYADDAERTELSDRADDAVAEFLDREPKHPARAGLEVLRGELSLTRGETLRWLAELRPDVPAYRGDAEQTLAAAAERLGHAERTLEVRLRNRVAGKTTARTELLSAADLFDLLSRARVALGRTELERARLAPQPAEHLEAAERRLELVAGGPRTEERTWRAQVLLAEAARLGGKPGVARRRLAAVDAASLPDAAKDAVAAVTAKLLLDEGEPDEAGRFLIDYRRARGTLDGELRLLQVQALANAADVMERSGNDPEAEALRAQIPTVVRWAEAEQGGYWAYRIRLAARDAERAGRLGGEVAEVVRRAEAAAASGRTDDAVTAYAEAARLSEEPAAAAGFAFAGASALLRSDRFDDAAAAFAETAERYPDAERAAEAHLLAAYALGRLHESQPSPERREAYVSRLEEHRGRFPGTPTAAEATLRLARFLEGRRQHTKVVPLLKEIVGDPERGPTARAGVARNYANLLLHLESSRRSAADPAEAAARDAQIAEWSAAAVRDLTELTEPLRSAAPGPPPLSASEAELALRAARVLITYGGDETAAGTLVDRLAEAVAADHPEAESEFWAAARRSTPPLRVLSLAARGRYEEAGRAVEALADVPAGDLLAVLRGLAELDAPEARPAGSPKFGAADGGVGPRLSDLRRSTADLLARRRTELSPAESRQLDLALAETKLADGRTEDAAQQYEAALAGNPNDKGLLTRAATALLESGDAAAAARARTYWRRLESLEKPGTEPWLRARARVIESSRAAGDLAEARKTLKATRLLHPQLGGPETKALYEALARDLDAASEPQPPGRK